jgi:hypothetical protein
LQLLDEIQAFVAVRDQFPSPKSPESRERTLARWLLRRRQDAAAGVLSPAYAEALAKLPGWDQSARARAEEARWRLRLSQLTAYVEAGGDWPRHKDTDSEQERVLGVWLHIQRSSDVVVNSIRSRPSSWIRRRQGGGKGVGLPGDRPPAVLRPVKPLKTVLKPVFSGTLLSEEGWTVRLRNFFSRRQASATPEPAPVVVAAEFQELRAPLDVALELVLGQVQGGEQVPYSAVTVVGRPAPSTGLAVGILVLVSAFAPLPAWVRHQVERPALVYAKDDFGLAVLGYDLAVGDRVEVLDPGAFLAA